MSLETLGLKDVCFGEAQAVIHGTHNAKIMDLTPREVIMLELISF